MIRTAIRWHCALYKVDGLLQPHTEGVGLSRSVRWTEAHSWRQQGHHYSSELHVQRLRPRCREEMMSGDFLVGDMVIPWWRRSVVVSGVGLINEVNRHMGPVSTWMGDHLRAGKPSRYVTSHLGQLSLLSLRGIGKSSTGLTGWGEGVVRSLVSGRR